MYTINLLVGNFRGKSSRYRNGVQLEITFFPKLEHSTDMSPNYAMSHRRIKSRSQHARQLIYSGRINKRKCIDVETSARCHT